MLLQCFSDSHCLITSESCLCSAFGAVLIGMAFSNAMYILHLRIRFQDHDDVYYIMYNYTCIVPYFESRSPTHKIDRTVLIVTPSLSFKTTSFTVTAFDGFWMLRRQWTWCSSCPTSSLWCAVSVYPLRGKSPWAMGDAELGGWCWRLEIGVFFFENWITRLNLLGEGGCVFPRGQKRVFREKRFHLSNVSSDDACGHYWRGPP